MKRWGLLCVALGVLVTTAPAQNDDAAKKEYERFRGTWKFVSVEVEGVKVPIEQFKNARLILDGDKFTMNDGLNSHKGTYKVDLSKTPKQFDATFTDGPEKGKTSLAIYELDGDVYKVCIGLAGQKERPKEFVSKPGSGHVLEVLHREKK